MDVNRFILGFLVLSVMLECGTGHGAGEPPQGGKSIAIVTVGVIDNRLFERIKNFVSKNYWYEVEMKPHRKVLKKSITEESYELARLLDDDNICLLALINIPEEVKFREAHFESSNVAFLNIFALLPDKLDGDEAYEQYARRVEKESMRLIGSLIGLEPCPIPRCALSIIRSEQELDAKGRNLCPPCQGKAEKVLKAKGIRLTFE